MKTHIRSKFGRASAPMAWLLALGIPVILAACSGDALKVVDPEQATTANVTPDVAFAGAVSDFQHAYAGQGGGQTDNEGIVSVSGVFTDEFHSSGTFPTRNRTDQRHQFSAQDGNTSDLAYTYLQQARTSAIAAENLLGSGDPRTSQLKSYVGYVYTAMAENFCSGVPFSTSTDYAPAEPGAPLSTPQMFTAAVDTFKAAKSAAGGNTQDKWLAQVGEGRALLNTAKTPADYQQAAAAVSGVPTSFVFDVEYSTSATVDENQIYDLQEAGRYSISDGEGGNGLDFRSADDPRIPWGDDSNGGFTHSIPLYVALRYPLKSSNVVLADGIEARLIEAESDLNNGDVSGWLTTLNDLRDNVSSLMSARYDNPAAITRTTVTVHPVASSLPHLTDPGTQAARVDMMFRERAFWLFLTGHRLGDLRRLIRNYGRSASTVFPVGAYFKGGGINYGTDVAFQMNYDERNNPKYSLSMCHVNQP